MWWVIISVCVCVAAAANEPSCPGGADCSLASHKIGAREFIVEGHKIFYSFHDERRKNSFPLLYMNCGGWEALDSPALPRFPNESYVSWVVFDKCPPPRNGSFERVLARINGVLQVFDDGLTLELLNLPRNALLTAQNFVGDKQFTRIHLVNESDPLQRPLPEAGFLSSCQNLRELYITNFRLPAGELERLPHSITRLLLGGTSLNILPTTLPEIIKEITRAMPALSNLFLQSFESTAPSLTSTKIEKNLNTTRSSLTSINLNEWNQKSIIPLTHCEVLKSLQIYKTKVEELPDRWVAACPQLEHLHLSAAPQITSLPAKLLDGAAQLNRLGIANTNIESLPEGFFEGVPNLTDLDLSGNRLQTIPSGTFQGLPLQILSLRSNKLTSESLNAVASLTDLQHLDLSENEELHDVCEPNGFSSLQNLTELRAMSLEKTSITRVCRDWRSNFPMLRLLVLTGTKIVELHFTDLQHPRYDWGGVPTVEFSNTVTSIELTENDYKAALELPGPQVTFTFRSDEGGNQTGSLVCDCRAYWLRRVVDSSSPAIKVEGLRCSDGRTFESVSVAEKCPDATV